MAEQDVTPEMLAQIAAANEESEINLNYKPPAQKSLDEIKELDKDDDSLRKYKEQLLGNSDVVKDPSVPNVQVTQMKLICQEAQEDLTLDLTGDLGNFKKNPYTLKEGVEYKVQISFKVNKEIVSGLRYNQVTFRKGVKVDKTDFMVGSYGPRPDKAYEYITPLEEAPKGLLARGTYNIKSKFTDDDKNDHLSWEWSLAIKKDWKD